MKNHLVIFGIINMVWATENKSSKLIEEALRITTKYYNNKLITAVFWAYEDSEEINIFLLKYRGPVTIIKHNNNATIPNMMQKMDNWEAIFFIKELEPFARFVSLIKEYVKMSLRLVLVFNKNIKSLLELTPFMKLSWDIGLVDMVILSKDQSGEVIISTYYPYSNGICGNILPVLLNPNQDFFPNKFRNFNNCPIRVSVTPFMPYVDITYLKYDEDIVTEVGGHDGFALSLIANKLNATLNINIDLSDDYGTYSEGNATGGFSELVNNKADIIVPAGLLTLGRYSASLSSHFYHTVDIRWIGPKHRVIYNELKLLLPFISIMTPILCLIFCIFVTVAFLIRNRSITKDDKSKYVCNKAYAMLLGQTVHLETKVTFLNCFFLIWIWFCFIVRIAYQGDLVQSLQNQILEPPFESLEDAVSKVNGYGGLPVLKEYYKNTSLEHDFQILGLFDTQRYPEAIAAGKRFLLATDTFLVQHIRHSLQILDSQITSGVACLFMRFRWPAALAVDTIVVRLVESGIIEKIRTPVKNQLPLEINDENVRALDMTMLSLCFYFLIVMSITCFVIFLIEIIYDRYNKSRLTCLT